MQKIKIKIKDKNNIDNLFEKLQKLYEQKIN